MKKLIRILFLLTFFLIGCSNQDNRKLEIQETSLLNPELEILTDELDVPWSINKLGNTFYLSERSGSIVKVDNGTKERQSVVLKQKLATASEAGLLGFVLAPDFTESNEAFAYYTYEDSLGQFNRIVSLSFKGGHWEEDKLLLDRIPSGAFHHGGRLAIGPDGKLYATTGDASSAPEIAQDHKSLGGKILRLNLDGSIPTDNPFPQSYIYSYGHRNPQGLAWGSNNSMYASEHGPSANDEMNTIVAGKNYGWPVIQGGEEIRGMETPLFTSGEDNTWAPSGIGFFDGKLYVAALRGSTILEFDLETGEKKEIIKGLGRIRDIFIEKESLYFISNNTDGRGQPLEKDDKLYRMPLESNQ
jgi:glucose/arabinose dehydrogenase